MADFNIPENPIFEEEVRQLETADRAHASIFNNILAKLFHNNVFNRKKQQEHETNKQNPHGVTPTQIGAATKSALDMAYQNGNAYTDAKIAELINGAPNTMDTLKEISDAMLANKTVVDAIESSIGSKAPKAEFDTHVANKTLHITAAERTKWNTVDNALSGTSTNSIQNKVVKTAFDQQNTKNSGFESSIASINSNLGATVGNGYVKFANGLLLCHGHTYSQTTVTLPISYINAQFSVTVSDLSSDPHFIGCRIVNKSAITPWAWTPSAPALANNILLSYTTIGLYK